ncbi:MAG: MBOAT family protein [Anaerolineaceae bacterium]|nr:MBOAT family protein [Anaerolineaceae bacterium]
MNFVTAVFLFLFLPFFLIFYFFAQPRWRPLIGILASLLFYAWGSVVNLVWIAALILFNYWLGRRLEAKPAKWILPLGLLGNVGVLAFFKVFIVYGDGFLLRFGEFLPGRVAGWLDALTFPLGLSYISFQLISYLLDVRKGAVKAEGSLGAFAFYILLFPKLLVGPIVRYRTLAESLPAPTLDTRQISGGMRRFMAGFAKKILIADTLSKVVDATFGLPVGSTTPLFGWLALTGYALQIYYDFSGYTDMAIGLASMMGLRFAENFNNPYMAESVGDFWRRWHISLSSWFRDYVFYPLERRRVPVIGQPLNVLIVFLLTGLWHGAAVEFALWGALHGFFIALENLFLNRWLRRLFRPLRRLYALTVVLFTWLIFRAPNLEYAGSFLKFLFSGSAETIPLSFLATSPLPFIEPSFLIAFAAGVLFCLPLGDYLYLRAERSPFLRLTTDLLLFVLFIISIGAMVNGQFLPGIYERF